MAQIDEHGIKHTFFSLGNFAQNQHTATSSASNFVRDMWGGYSNLDEFYNQGESAQSKPPEEECCKHLIALNHINSWSTCEFCRGEKLLEDAARNNALIAKGDESSWCLNCNPPDYAQCVGAKDGGAVTRENIIKQPNWSNKTEYRNSEQPQVDVQYLSTTELVVEEYVLLI